MKFINYHDGLSKESHYENTPTCLLVEYAANPIGIDVVIPRFSWMVNHEGREQSQSAYRILVADDQATLDNNVGDIWDSGKVQSGQSVNIRYEGKELKSGQACWWKVQTWDKDGKPGIFSATAKFEMGLLNKDDWEGDWIGLPIFETKCSFMFRKVLKLERKISKARIYICGLGYYELWINGKKIGDNVLDPGNTNYSKRALYVTYEVENHLKEGANAIGIILGDGWYKSPKFILQMNIEYTDGQKQKFYSDPKTWLSVTSPIVFNSIYGGEFYDSKFEKTGWNDPDVDFESLYKEKYWRYIAAIPIRPGQVLSKELSDYKNSRYRAMLLPGPGGDLKAQMLEPIKVITEIVPILMTNPQPGIYVYDVGQNIAGWAKLKVEGPKDTIVKLRFSELLLDDGTVNQGYLQIAYKIGDYAQTDMYVLKGEGIEIFQPRFTYHGFRYVQLEGFPGEPDIGSVTACVVRSSVKTTGDFECGNKLINDIQSNVLWTESCNLHSIPTDCPQRDERQGWLNDMTARAEEAVYNFDMARLYTKWVTDIRDEQDMKSGAIADTAPFRRAMRPADPVSSSYLIVPWLVYLHYGDTRILESNYQGLKKWLEFLEMNSYDGIIGYSYYGDWASPKGECSNQTCDAYSIQTPGELVSTAFYYYNTVLLSQMAKILGKGEDERKFLELGAIIKKAFNDKFFNPETNQYATGSQGSNAIALYHNLVPKDRIRGVVENLVKDIMELHDGHLTTGNLCTKYLLEVLTEHGHVDVAYTLATNTTYPSWGYMISRGATTIWERWEYADGVSMNSHNHPMYGSLSAWFYKYLAGIRVDTEGAGFKRIIIKPYIPDGLEYVDASLETVKGTIKSNWKKTADSFSLKVTVPVNSTAKVSIPVFDNIENSQISDYRINMWRSGEMISDLKEIKTSHEEPDFVTFAIGSGDYRFEVDKRSGNEKIIDFKEPVGASRI